MRFLVPIYFVGVTISFLLTRLIYIKYLNSIGLDYNPNKPGFLGLKAFYNIPDVINKYLEEAELKKEQIKKLNIIKNWEKANLILFGLLPILVLIYTIVVIVN